MDTIPGSADIDDGYSQDGTEDAYIEEFPGLDAFWEQEESDYPLVEMNSVTFLEDTLSEEECYVFFKRVESVFARLTAHYGIPLFLGSEGIPSLTQDDYNGVLAGGYWSGIHGKIIILLAPAPPDELLLAKSEILSVTGEYEDLLVFRRAEYSYRALLDLEKRLSQQENMIGQRINEDGSLTAFQVVLTDISILNNCVEVTILDLNEEKAALYREMVCDSPAVVLTSSVFVENMLLIGPGEEQ